MKRFLKFRSRYSDGHSLIDRNHVVGVTADKDGDTVIRFIGGGYIYVRETDAEVVAAIEAAEAEDRAADDVAEAIRRGGLFGSSEPGAARAEPAPEAGPIPLRAGQVWDGMAGVVPHRAEILDVNGDGVRRRVIEGLHPGQISTLDESSFRRYYTRLVSDAPEPEPIPVRPMQVRRGITGELVLVLDVGDADAEITGGGPHSRFEGRVEHRIIQIMWPEVIHEEAPSNG